MAISIVFGKPGSGKSLYATGKLIEELRTSQRNIVTNLPLNMDRLNAFMQLRYPNKDYNVLERVFLLPDAELKRFYLYRGSEDVMAFFGEMPERVGDLDGLPVDVVERLCSEHRERVRAWKKRIDDANRKVGQMIETAAASEKRVFGSDQGRGVAYFLDEAQIPFNARDWASVDRSVFNYLAQHRKLGDVIFACTQAFGNLDKQFRSLAQDFRKCRNNRLVKLGVFRGFDSFSCRHYEVEPSGKVEAYSTETYKLEKDGVASCYDTARGIGVKGSQADMGARAKGITVGWGVAGLFLLAGFVWVVPWVLGKATTKYLGVKDSPKKVERSLAPTQAAAAGVSRSPAVDGAPVAAAAPLWVRGFLARGNRVQVLLSDGRTLSEADKALTSVDRTGVVFEGRRIYLQQPEKSLVVASAPPVAVAPVVAPVLPEDRDRGAWMLGGDGVMRLKNPDTLATLTRR